MESSNTGGDQLEPSWSDQLEPSWSDQLEPSGDDQLEPSGDDQLEPSGDDQLEPSGDDQLEPSTSSAACVTLPSEVWAQIFTTLPDGWYHSQRLATVSWEFAEVAGHWKSRVCQTITFDFKHESSQVREKNYLMFIEMARRCGNDVEQLVLTDELYLTKPGERISPDVVASAFRFMPNLIVLDLRKTYFGQDSTILDAILELKYLEVLRVTLCAHHSVFYNDFEFNFSDEAMDTLASIAVNMSLQITFVGLSASDGNVIELLHRINEKKGKRQIVQVIYRGNLPA